MTRRNNKDIREAYDEFWKKVWYERHMRNQPKVGQDAARCIEEKYGKAKLAEMINDPFEHGMIYGQMRALAWVLGAEWNEAGDT
jgi:hypothetical protein